jgi:hypothetical protein
MTVINFRQALEDAGSIGEPVPDSTYDVQCYEAKAQTARSGKPMVVARFRILSGPYANRTIVHNFVWTEESSGAQWHWFNNFAILGLPSSYFSGNPPLEQVAVDLLQRQSRVVVKTEGGRQNIDSFSMVPGGPIQDAAPPQAPVAAPGMTPPPVQAPVAAPASYYQPPTVQAPPAYQAPQPQVAPPPVVAPAPAPMPAPAPAPMPAAAPAPAPAPAPQPAPVNYGQPTPNGGEDQQAPAPPPQVNIPQVSTAPPEIPV